MQKKLQFQKTKNIHTKTKSIKIRTKIKNNIKIQWKLRNTNKY